MKYLTDIEEEPHEHDSHSMSHNLIYLSVKLNPGVSLILGCRNNCIYIPFRHLTSIQGGFHIDIYFYIGNRLSFGLFLCQRNAKGLCLKPGGNHCLDSAECSDKETFLAVTR